MQPLQLITQLQGSCYDDKFNLLYGSNLSEIATHKNRYIEAIKEFMKLYPQHNDIQIYSASRRSEIGGNHTDHQKGCVLACAINLDIISIVAFYNNNI